MQQQHYVVLLRTGANGVLVFDPAMGPVFYPTADFDCLYSGNLLEVQKPSDASTLPARQQRSTPVGGAKRWSVEPAALFIVGFATRLLECAILLCLVAVLYLVLNQASFPSLLMAFGLIGVCGVLLLVAHQVKFEGEDGWIRRNQNRLWRGVLRTAVRGRDLSGFRAALNKRFRAPCAAASASQSRSARKCPRPLARFLPCRHSLLSQPVSRVGASPSVGLLLVVVQLDGVKSVGGPSARALVVTASLGWASIFSIPCLLRISLRDCKMDSDRNRRIDSSCRCIAASGADVLDSCSDADRTA